MSKKKAMPCQSQSCAPKCSSFCIQVCYFQRSSMATSCLLRAELLGSHFDHTTSSSRSDAIATSGQIEDTRLFYTKSPKPYLATTTACILNNGLITRCPETKRVDRLLRRWLHPSSTSHSFCISTRLCVHRTLPPAHFWTSSTFPVPRMRLPFHPHVACTFPFSMCPLPFLPPMH